MSNSASPSPYASSVSSAAGVSTVLALALHFVLKTCSVQLHLPMLLLANLVSVPIEVRRLANYACSLLPIQRFEKLQRQP